MASENARDALVRQAESVPTDSRPAGPAASAGGQLNAPPGSESLHAKVTRRRLRVNFRQRYESRGVDKYREHGETTRQDDETTLDVLK